MQALHSNHSYIRINFGQKHAPQTPLSLELILDFFSSQQQNVKNELSKFYKAELPATCFAFEFIVENGSAQQTMQRLSKCEAEQKAKVPGAIHNTLFYHNDNKVFVVVQAPDYAQLIQSKQSYFAELKTLAANQNHAIHLRIQSENDLKTIGEKSKEFGRLAWLENTHFEFGFVKTDLVSNFLTIFFQKIIGVDSFNSILKSFKKLNLELNFAGGDYLREFPKIKTGGFLAAQVHQNTEFVRIFQEGGVEKAKFYGFNPTIFLKGDFLGTGLKHHLQLAFK